MKTIYIDGNSLTIEALQAVVKGGAGVELSPKALRAVTASNNFLRRNIQGRVLYGINTGFGPMANHLLGQAQLYDLQVNLVRSHAVGIGAPIPDDFVMAAMVVRYNTLAKGYSGVSVELLEQLKTFINKRIIPVIPEHGAVGTSGDLVQLAHIALALIGEGVVTYEGKQHKTSQLIKKLKIKPYTLKPKEGLALINGTSLMTGVAAILTDRATRLLELELRNSAFALELVHAFDDSIAPELHKLRPHPGQVHIAKRLQELVKDSRLLQKRKVLKSKFNWSTEVLKLAEAIQEVYSLRCVPQILGPIYDTLAKTRAEVLVEMNSVTDNPVVDPNKKLFLHGGNFHGDYISATMDQLKMVMVKLSILSERRTNFFLNTNVNRKFPPFLNVKKPGLTLALQGLQFVATSTTAQNQTLAFPQYVHSIPTNGDNQDVVSMGTDSALLTAKVIDNSFIVASIESAVLAQAADVFDEKPKLSKAARMLYGEVRNVLRKTVEDRAMAPELAELVESLKSVNFTS